VPRTSNRRTDSEYTTEEDCPECTEGCGKKTGHMGRHRTNPLSDVSDPDPGPFVRHSINDPDWFWFTCSEKENSSQFEWETVTASESETPEEDPDTESWSDIGRQVVPISVAHYDLALFKREAEAYRRSMGPEWPYSNQVDGFPPWVGNKMRENARTDEDIAMWKATWMPRHSTTGEQPKDAANNEDEAGSVGGADLNESPGSEERGKEKEKREEMEEGGKKMEERKNEMEEKETETEMEEREKEKAPADDTSEVVAQHDEDNAADNDLDNDADDDASDHQADDAPETANEKDDDDDGDEKKAAGLKQEEEDKRAAGEEEEGDDAVKFKECAKCTPGSGKKDGHLGRCKGEGRKVDAETAARMQREIEEEKRNEEERREQAEERRLEEANLEEEEKKACEAYAKKKHLELINLLAMTPY
jgi:hypothetical protein